MTDSQRALAIQPGPQQLVGADQDKDTLYCLGDLKEMLTGYSGSPTLLFAQKLEIAPGVFRNITVNSDGAKGKLVMNIAPIVAEEGEKAGLDTSTAHEYHILLNSQTEGSRVVSGCFASGLHHGDTTISSHLKNMIYTFEVASATSRKEKAIRFTIFDQAKEAPLLSVVFADNSLYAQPAALYMKEEMIKSLKTHTDDTLPLLKQMRCLSYDYRRGVLAWRFKEGRSSGGVGDLSREFR